VPETYVPAQAQHVAALEHVTDETIALARMQPPVLFGHDACGILAAVLQHRQRVVQALVDRFLADYSDDSTHVLGTSVLDPTAQTISCSRKYALPMVA
jgi:hypothetical protein